MRSRLLSAVALVVALAAFAGSFWLFPHAGVPECSQTVSEISADAVPENATVVAYDALSARGQQVIDEGPGIVTVHGDCPAAFVYTDAPEIGRGIHYVQGGGTYFEVQTMPGGVDWDSIAQMLLRATAGFLGLVGGAFYYYRRTAASVALGGGALSLLAIAVVAPAAVVPRGTDPWPYALAGTWLLILLTVSYVAWDQSRSGGSG